MLTSILNFQKCQTPGKFGEKKKEDKKPEEVINELDEEFEDPRASDRRR